MGVKDPTFRPWVVFAGCVLVVAVLYWAQAVFVPIAVAALLAFLLTQPVSYLERRIGRVAAVLTVVALLFSVLSLAAWGFAREVSGLAGDLPSYRTNIREKIADVRGASRGGSVEKIQDTLEDIQEEVTKEERPRGTPAQPVVVVSQQVAGLWGFPTWVGAALEPLATAGLVLVLVIFMLLERQDLRGRLIGLIGHGHLPVTTKALDEAATRVSRYLLRQTAVNATFGAGVAIGLYLIGVPYWPLWAGLAAMLRFIPYVGPWIGAGAPILVSLAALPGWTQGLMVIGLFAGLELFTNLVLETYLYAGAAGVSQVALLVSVAFWTWLWGPLGLLMATPLTVCLVVIGKHVPGLEFLATLMADRPALAPDVSYYQRLLARDQSEAAELLERHARATSPETVYDALMIPALNYAERDRIEERLSADEETAVIAVTRELLTDAEVFRPAAASARVPGGDRHPEPAPAIKILGYPSNSSADDLALRMLEQLLAGTSVALEIASNQTLTAELVSRVQQGDYAAVCIVDLPPSAPSKTRYVVKKLRTALPGLPIVVGRWAPPAFADESPAQLAEAGATAVATTLLDTRQYLRQIARQAACEDVVADVA